MVSAAVPGWEVPRAVMVSNTSEVIPISLDQTEEAITANLNRYGFGRVVNYSHEAKARFDEHNTTLLLAYVDDRTNGKAAIAAMVEKLQGLAARTLDPVAFMYMQVSTLNWTLPDFGFPDGYSTFPAYGALHMIPQPPQPTDVPATQRSKNKPPSDDDRSVSMMVCMVVGSVAA